MRRLLNFLLQLVALALVIFVLTAAWIVFDGLNDGGDKADVGLFTSTPDAPLDPQVEHAAKLYKDGAFTTLIVCERRALDDRTPASVRALEEHGVPADAIVAHVEYTDTWEMARKVVDEMKEHEDSSVMLVCAYYRMTRLKVALGHEGVGVFSKSHFGTFTVNDAFAIGHEVVALYDYLGKTFVLPTAEKLKQEAKVDADKAKAEAAKAKDRINKDLDNLPK